MDEILVLDLHTQNDLTEGPKISRALQQYLEVSVAKLFSPDFNYGILKNCRGLVLTGSDNSGLLTSPEIEKLKPYLIDMSDNRIQILGLCAGHEVLAITFGFRVYEFKEPEVGWSYVSLTEKGKADSLFHNFPERFEPFEYHKKAVRCTDREKILAENSFSPQAVLYQPTVRGVQFHPEESRESASEFLRTAKQGRYAHLIPSAPAGYIEWMIFKNYVDMVRR